VKAIEAADRDTPPGAGVAYPWGLGYWVEGLAGRPVYDVNERELQVFAAAGQRTETLSGNVVLAGERVTTNGWVFAADAYSVPDVPMDPVLGIDNAYLEHLLYLDDRLIEIEYGTGSASRRVSLAETAPQESVSEIKGGAFVDRRVYDLGDLRVVKEITLPEQGDRATVVLRVESAGGPVTSLVVPVQAALPARLLPLDPQQVMFGFTGQTHFGGGWWAGVYVDVTGGGGEAPTLTAREGEPVAVAQVRPQSSRAEVTLAFIFKGEPFGDTNGLRSYTAEDVIRERGITFAVVDRYPEKPWYGDALDVTTLAWLESAPYFEPLWEGGSVAAYRVAPEPPREASAGP
jgi:hypothetical protein